MSTAQESNSKPNVKEGGKRRSSVSVVLHQLAGLGIGKRLWRKENTTPTWRRAKDVVENPVLFNDGVGAEDVVQGCVLGDCWIMAAVACLTEFPASVHEIILTKKYTRDPSSLSARMFGKYKRHFKVRLYDHYQNKHVVHRINDNFPTIPLREGELTHTNLKGGKNIGFAYAEPVGNEIWVPVLEKAFAKMFGDYRNLDGGMALYAFSCLTSGEVFRYRKIVDEENSTKDETTYLECWGRHFLPTKKPISLHVRNALRRDTARGDISTDELFGLLLELDERKCMFGASRSDNNPNASFKGEENINEVTGLVSAHVYSILQVRKVTSSTDNKEYKLLQMRNPWGGIYNSEHKMKWNDESSKWTEHPNIATELKFEKKLDGIFWIEYDDFISFFNNVDVCTAPPGHNKRVSVSNEAGPSV